MVRLIKGLRESDTGMRRERGDGELRLRANTCSSTDTVHGNGQRSAEDIPWRDGWCCSSFVAGKIVRLFFDRCLLDRRLVGA